MIIQRRLLKLFFCVANSLQSLKPILSPHILRILQQDQESSKKYKNCLESMSKIIEKYPQEDARIRCNLIFNAGSVSDSLQHLREVLYQLVLEGQIRSQSELDQLLKWLSKEIKNNSQVGEKQIRDKIGERSKEIEEFEEEIEKLSTQTVETNQSQLCKWLRGKYTTVDSRHIFDCVSKLFKSKEGQQECSPRKDNKLWDKLLDIKPRQLKLECNSKQISEQHAKITQGKPRFRFPPQPNGYLHIGHVKSMRINFESALKTGGTCYLRYDDTNPDKQSHEFIEEIEQNIKWLGYTPDKITFASDYFEPLQDFAYRLIKEGKAYVCDSPQQDIQNQRKTKSLNPYRSRTIEESLKFFPNLEQYQTLRLKGVYNSANPTLRDPIIYRRKAKPHPRTGSKFKIYPTYDFAHSTCDSLEHIDYSLCSLEFEVRRELYYTFLDLLGLWKPLVWEYSRLNIEGNVLSKRKIKDMIEEGKVSGWDDPRLLTIRGLINRGYTPDMLIGFIDKVNCSRSGNQNYVQYSLLEQQMKRKLMTEAPKTMAVLQPVKTTIKNQRQASGPLLLDRSDVIKLSSGQKIILKNLGVFSVENVTQAEVIIASDGQQNVSALKKAFPQTKVLHWVYQNETLPFKIVLYDRLLNANGEHNPDSKKPYRNSRVPKQVLNQRPEYIQLQRIGFFKFSGEEIHLCTRL